MTNMDKWNDLYKDVGSDVPLDWYGNTETYDKGAEFLKDCDAVEDWGCGVGWFKTKCLSKKYTGIDGSITPHSDKKADLTKYKSNCEGIFMRHVLEHNLQWKDILMNACESFTQKFVLILFTQFKEKTEVIAWNEIGVPDISFRKEDITSIFDQYGLKYEMETIEESKTQYGIEYIFLIKKMHHESMTDRERKWEDRLETPKDNYERWIDKHNHKLELVRTVGSIIAAVTGLLVFLKVFNFI